MNQVGKNIKRLRIEKGVTQDDMAVHLSVTRQAVSNWERGIAEPDIDTLEKICAYFNVPMEELIYGAKRNTCVSRSVTDSGGKAVKIGVTMGSCLAMIISYSAWNSIGWAILHGFMSWGYVLYYLIKYIWN
jgi:DNA-binding XRE family transcriptional regulator